jgi:hypothetical protein
LPRCCFTLQVTAAAEASSAETAAALAAAAARVAELEEQAEQHNAAGDSPVAVAAAVEPTEQQQLAEARAQTAGLRERQGRMRVRGAADEVMHNTYDDNVLA